jgi:hypothetical protein
MHQRQRLELSRRWPWSSGYARWSRARSRGMRFRERRASGNATMMRGISPLDQGCCDASWGGRTGIEGRRSRRRGLVFARTSYLSMDPSSHRRRRSSSSSSRHHCHRDDDANNILIMTDGVVDAPRDEGRYVSAGTFAGARLMHAERGMRRLEAERDSVRRERMVRRGEARARRRCHRCCHRWCRGRPRGGDGGGVDANDDDGTPLFSSDGEDGDDPGRANSWRGNWNYPDCAGRIRRSSPSIN